MHAELADKILVRVRAILTAAVRVVNQAGRWSVRRDRAKQRLHHQMLCHTLAHRIADQLSAEQVLETSQVQPGVTVLLVQILAVSVERFQLINDLKITPSCRTPAPVKTCRERLGVM